MTINKIFGNQGVGPVGGGKGAQRVNSPQAGTSRQTDQVDFSSVLQEVSRGKVSSPADAQRAEKVASLKAQIASGRYQPDLHKVAASLLHFVMEDGK